MKTVAKIETAYSWTMWRSRIAQAIIRFGACIGKDMEVDFIPWGLMGDMLGWMFYCTRCHGTFYAIVSPSNETLVKCPYCKTSYLTVNNCDIAWIMGRAE